MAHKRSRPNPDGIITAKLAGTASRHSSSRPLDVAAAVAELREIAAGRSDLLAEQAGLTLGARAYGRLDSMWPRTALQAALLVAAGADLAQLEK